MDRGTRISIAENLRQPSFTSPWIALYHLLERPWRERAWVLQEITLAKAAFVYCRNQSQPWIVVATAARIACDTRNMIFRMLVEQGSWEPQLFTFTNRNPIEQLGFTRENWMQCYREARRFLTNTTKLLRKHWVAQNNLSQRTSHANVSFCRTRPTRFWVCCRQT